MPTPSIPGTINVTTLTGSERVSIGINSPQSATTTTALIAGLAASSSTTATITSITTVGAGTVTAAGIVGRTVLRSGPTGAYTDTTDTAANIIAALPSGTPTGAAFTFVYINSTAQVCTFSSGTGVTVKNIAGTTASVTVAPKSIVHFLVTVTSSSAVTMQQTLMSFYTTTIGTFTCNGATPVTVTDAAVSANSAIVVTLKTVGGTVGAIPAIKTITAGTGFTIAGTASDTSVYNYLILG